MDPFSPVHQPDEGYSEDPLNPQDSSALLASLSSFQSPSDLAAWMARNASMFPTSVKAELTMALLAELPTSTIAGIVQRLRPRLYIDFINHLPAEICLKILSFLDPISLVNVLQTCHAWYDLALDRKLWERLYHLEGWKVIHKEIEAEERRVNENINNSISQMQPDGPVNKVRAIMSDEDEDMEMVDSERAQTSKDSFTGQSLFGSPSTSFSSSRRAITPLGDVDMSNYFSKGKAVDRSFSSTDVRSKRKAPDSSPEPLTASPATMDSNAQLRSKLWTWDSTSSKYRLNWKYLYSMRRKLESNWELGKFSTFMFPHPDFPEEGHQECVYTIQFDSNFLVSGSRDRTMRIWDMKTGRLARAPLAGHHGSVLCLQFDADPEEDLLVSGSSDSNVFIWKFSTGELVQRITRAHKESVLNVRFDKNILVTSSKDKTIKIFNRRPLRYGDLGYEPVGSVAAASVKPYGYEPDLAQELPVKMPFTMIGRLDGHSAAVNAIQVKGRTIVSVSGDRQIKVWDWPDQVCKQTIPAHEKGIACVEFDERRIVSGSSDFEVCIFDAPTGLKVASLRGHANLVRTVQAGFGDLPYSKIEDEAEARLVDAEYLKAVETGEIGSGSDRRAARRSRRANAGSSKPEDIQVFGAKVPPGGGGGRKYGRIVSGSYDQSIIIWRRDKEGVWRPAHYLRQEEAAELVQSQHAHGALTTQPRQASLPMHHSAAIVHQGTASQLAQQQQAALQLQQQAQQPAADVAGNQRVAGLYMAYIDQVVPAGVTALEHALANYPAMLGFHTYLQSAIEREASPHLRLQLRQAVTTALTNIQNGRVQRQRRELVAPSAVAASSSSAAATAGSLTGASTAGSSASGSQSRRAEAASSSQADSSATPQAQPAQQPQAQTQQVANQVQAPVPAPAVPFQAGAAQAAAAAPSHHHPHRHHHHPHLTPAENAPARVFKLQFDARKIICCTQSPIIVGWDFCNGDKELQEASRFFATID